MNIVGDALAGATSRKSYAIGSPFAGRYTTKPPPPMLPAVGCTTASANAVATAASTAVPPSLMTSAPMRDAVSFCDATMPYFARIGTDPAPSVVEISAHAAATATKRFMKASLQLDYRAEGRTSVRRV